MWRSISASPGLRVPVDVERLDLGAQEVVGAGGAELGEARGVVAVDELERGFVVLDGGDKALLLADLAAQPREQVDEEFAALGAVECLVLRAAEGALALVVLGEVARGFLDEIERELVALFVVVGPIDQAVLAHDDAFGLGIFAADFLELEAEVEAGALPGGPDHFVAVDFPGELGGILRRGDGDAALGWVWSTCLKGRSCGAACRWRVRAG